MTENVVRQRLAAILAADVAGYSRLMGDDERATINAINRCRAVFREHIEGNGGRVVDMAGDSVLAIFDTAIGAFTTAIAAQERLADLNNEFAEDRRMAWRVGVNLGDIHEQDDGTVYGDGVNVAARLEALAEPGGICLSDKVHTEVRGKIDRGFADLGEHDVKNIAEPVRAYRVLAEGEVAPATRNRSRPLMLAGAAMAMVVIAAVALWPSPEPQLPTEGATSGPDGELPPLPTGPSIAVLPFDNLGGDPEQEYFADGLTEDILTRLAAFRDLKVIARNSSFQYKGEAVDVREVGRDLGAAFVLEGSVRRDATSIRVSAQLLDAKDGAHVWQQTYDRELSAGSIFAIQDEITEQVASSLGGPAGAITASRIRRLKSGETDDLQSYECVLLAQQYVAVMTADSHLAARTCLVDVVAREPNYVEALVWLGQLYVEEIWSGFNSREIGPTSLEAAFEVLNRAVQLDPDHQLARKVLALAYYFDGDAEQFRDEARKAVALNPNDVNALAEMAMFVGFAGDWQGSKAITERLRSLVAEVVNWHNYTEFNYHYRDEDYAAAAASARATLEIEHWAGPWYLALAYAGMGEADKAMEALDKARALELDLTTEVVEEMVDALFLDQGHIALLMDGHAQLMALEESLTPSRPVIAVLPFDNMSGDPEQEYFADGITEDITTRLSRFGDLAVIARNSAFQYKGEAVDVEAVAKKLGADYVVEGSVRRSESRVRVTAQLLEAGAATHMWADTYDRDLTAGDVFDIQDEITEAIVGVIAGVHGVIARTAASAARQRPENLDSYECVLIANGYERTTSVENWHMAKTCLDAVLTREPDYVDALAAYSYIATDGYAMGWASSDAEGEEMLAAALAAGERAVDLAPDDANSHRQLSYASFVSGDVAGFRAHAERGLALNPNDSNVMGDTGTLMSFSGSYDRGLELITEAIARNPHHPNWWYLGVVSAHWMNGRHEDAAAALTKIDQPDNFWPYLMRTVVSTELRDAEGAAAALAQLYQLYPDFNIATYRVEAAYWQPTPEFIERAIAALRKAGVPEGTD
jgi:adenylate cyclase